MKKVLIIGVGPLPFENRKKIYGSSIRTWHFTKAVLEAGHIVCLVAMQLPDPHKEENLPPVIEIKTNNDNFKYYSVDELSVLADEKFLQFIHDKFQPDCIIGVNYCAAFRAVKLKTEAPIWVDFHGYTMAEAQLKAYKTKDDKFVQKFWDQERLILKRADIFSVTSLPHKYALIGELATLHRLNKKTVGYEFVHYIPCSSDPEEVKIKYSVTVLRNKLVKESDFIILWSGGYNVWTDVDTLFSGITLAMRENENIKFVSTGGQLDGHDEITYKKFLEKINKSTFFDRFIMLGWIPTHEVPNYYEESDLGINIDGKHYEVIFGSRNRLISMMQAGLPVLTTIGSEITQIIEKERLGLTFRVGDPEDLKEKILWAYTHRNELNCIADKAKKFVSENWHYKKTTLPLLNWINQANHAPDWEGDLK